MIAVNLIKEEIDQLPTVDTHPKVAEEGILVQPFLMRFLVSFFFSLL